MLLASVTGVLCYLGLFSDTARHLSHFISLVMCFITVPLIAVLTRGRFYLARQSPEVKELLLVSGDHNNLQCCICENAFEQQDMAYCPAHQGAICSLCCSLDARCMDSCKPDGRLANQLENWLKPWLHAAFFSPAGRRMVRFFTLFGITNAISASLLILVYYQLQPATANEIVLLQQALTMLFLVILIVLGVICWWYLLASESRELAQQESTQQTRCLMQEIAAHSHADEQLQRAKDLAERANEAKSRYLSGISHELRTPLQAILGYAQLLSQRDEIPQRNREAIQIIKRSGEHLAGLIEGLLDISKIEAGRLEIYRNHVKLPELIEQMIQMFRTMAMEKDIAFSCHIHNKLPEVVTTDEKRLRQILINLLSNAIKYTQQGSVEFHVRYRNQVAEFSIVDTGIGISGKDIQRILDPFERVRGPDSPNVPGTGLGLTIVRLLTDIMGGDLDITSTPGVGSCFKVSLMMSRVTGPLTLSPPQQHIDGYAGNRKTIMVVDDDPIHRGLMAELLPPLGFSLIESPDAFDCLEVLENMMPDIILLDVSMPGMDGLELAETLRARGFQQPIIMISADADERHRSLQTPSFHDAYLVKPINLQQLLDKIGSLLQLQWIQHGKTPDPCKPEPSIIPSSLTLPERHEITRELIACAEMGYKRGVQNKLNEMTQKGLISSAEYSYLKSLLDVMQFKQIVRSFQFAKSQTTDAPDAGENTGITGS